MSNKGTGKVSQDSLLFFFLLLILLLKDTPYCLEHPTSFLLFFLLLVALFGMYYL